MNDTIRLIAAIEGSGNVKTGFHPPASVMHSVRHMSSGVNRARVPGSGPYQILDSLSVVEIAKLFAQSDWNCSVIPVLTI